MSQVTQEGTPPDPVGPGSVVRDRGIRRLTFGYRLGGFAIGLALLVGGFLAGVRAGTSGWYGTTLAHGIEWAGEDGLVAGALGQLAAVDAEYETHGAMRPSALRAERASMRAQFETVKAIRNCEKSYAADTLALMEARQEAFERQARAADVILALHERKCGS